MHTNNTPLDSVENTRMEQGRPCGRTDAKRLVTQGVECVCAMRVGSWCSTHRRIPLVVLLDVCFQHQIQIHSLIDASKEGRHSFVLFTLSRFHLTIHHHPLPLPLRYMVPPLLSSSPLAIGFQQEHANIGPFCHSSSRPSPSILCAHIYRYLDVFSSSYIFVYFMLYVWVNEYALHCILPIYWTDDSNHTDAPPVLDIPPCLKLLLHAHLLPLTSKSAFVYRDAPCSFWRTCVYAFIGMAHCISYTYCISTFLMLHWLRNKPSIRGTFNLHHLINLFRQQKCSFSCSKSMYFDLQLLREYSSKHFWKKIHLWLFEKRIVLR